MTDTPSSDSAQGLGSQSDPLAPSDQADPSAGEGVSSSLAELESKLRELEGKLNLLATEPVPAAPAPPPVPHPPPGFGEPPPADGPQPRLVDEAGVPPGEEPAPAKAQESRLVDEALPDESRARAGRPSPGAQAELLGFGERLERLTRDLLEDYNQLLTRLAGQDAGAQPVSGVPAREPATHELTEFDGHVELGVGPFFNDLQWLSDFQSHVARIPNVTKTSIRRVEAGHAVLDLELSAPVALLAELRAAVDDDFSVRQISQNRLAITLEDS